MNVVCSFRIPRLVPALCLTALFQFGACAQAQPETSATLPPQPADSLPNSFIDIFDLDFTALGDEMFCSPNALLDYLDAANRHAAGKAPQVKVPHPKVDVAAQPPKLAVPKLHEVTFAEPDKSSKHAPKTFRASAYAIQGRTRSGAKTQKGVVAADPRVLPLGTVVQVSAGKYTGVYTVHDIGGAIKGNRLDVWMPTHKEARRFGRRNVKLVVLRYPGQNQPAAQQ